MTSTPRMPAFAVYQLQSSKKTTDCNSDADGIPESSAKSSKKTTDCNSDADGIPESSAKRQKTRQKSRKAAVKKTPFVKRGQKQEEEATVTLKKENNKKRGRKPKRKLVAKKCESESEEHSESCERSGGHSENGDIVESDESTDIQMCLISKPNSCGTKAAEEAFQWLLSPIPPSRFFEQIFECGPYYLLRNNTTYYKGLFGLKDFNKIISENRLEYNKEIDIVKYTEGQRKTIENGTIVYSDFVWDCFNGGYSVRMRNPQAYNQGLWQMCSLLQEYFSSCVGANMYLTPACSQGFPPHWDDIDAFILQIEGKKTWRIYSPRTSEEEFPQLSSPDLEESTIGSPIMEQEMSPGDMLYIPRGYIHQAQATHEYSLHVTISTNQQNTWSDFLLHGMEAALEEATKKNVALRKSIPKDYFDLAGSAAPQTVGSLDSVERFDFRTKAQNLVQEVLTHFTVDAAADVHAAHFLHGCMPPCYSKDEGARSIHENGNRFENGKIRKVSTLKPSTKVRWIRKRAFRLVVDADGSKLFHTLSNGKNAKEFDTGYLDVDETAVPAIAALFQKHPEYIKVKDLPLAGGNYVDKRTFAEILYYNGFLMTEEPLPLEDLPE